jgi:glutamate dehydrogenase
MIEKVRDPQDRQLLSWMHKFNQSVTATNLWKPEAAAVSFCMDPTKFLGQHRIPEVPYAVYMILGLDFTGFHIRFRDISRGGVRIIKSSEETYVGGGKPNIRPHTLRHLVLERGVFSRSV